MSQLVLKYIISMYIWCSNLWPMFLNDSWCASLVQYREIFYCFLAFVHVFIHYPSFTYHFPPNLFYSEMPFYAKYVALSYPIDVVPTLSYQQAGNQSSYLSGSSLASNNWQDILIAFGRSFGFNTPSLLGSRSLNELKKVSLIWEPSALGLNVPPCTNGKICRYLSMLMSKPWKFTRGISQTEFATGGNRMSLGSRRFISQSLNFSNCEARWAEGNPLWSNAEYQSRIFAANSASAISPFSLMTFSTFWLKNSCATELLCGSIPSSTNARLRPVWFVRSSSATFTHASRRIPADG